MKSFSRIVAIPKNYNQGFQMKYISIKIQNKQIPSAHSTSIAATFPFDSHRTLLGSGLEVLGSFFFAAEVVDFLAVGLLTCPSAGAPKYKKYNDIKNWYFVTKIVLTYCEKKMFY